MQADMTRSVAGDPAPGSLSVEDRRLLAEMGFLALTLGLPEPATRIFEALPAGPETGMAKAIGQAMSAVLAGRAEDAIRLLRDVELVRQPGDPDATAFLAVALLASGRQQQAIQLLEPMASGSAGPAFSELHRQAAQRLLARIHSPGAAT